MSDWTEQEREAYYEQERLDAERAAAEDHAMTDRSRELLAALKAMVDRYTSLVNCGDCGNWDPETEPEVQAARAAIASADAAVECSVEGDVGWKARIGLETSIVELRALAFKALTELESAEAKLAVSASADASPELSVPVDVAVKRIRHWLVQSFRYTAGTIELDEVLRREITAAVMSADAAPIDPPRAVSPDQQAVIEEAEQALAYADSGDYQVNPLWPRLVRSLLAALSQPQEPR